MSSSTKEEAEEVTDIFDEKIVDIMVMHVPITATFNYFQKTSQRLENNNFCLY